MRPLNVTSVALTFVVLLASPALSRAEVQELDATVSAEVIEYVGPVQGNSDLAFENLDETTGNLPLEARASLYRDPGDFGPAAGVAITTFYDPREAETEDPNEFNLSSAAFSFLPTITYDVLSASTETRTVSFLPEEIGRGDGTRLRARSQFFLDGILLIFARNDIDLSGTTAQASLRVLQTRQGQETPNTVLSATVTLTGQFNGDADVSTSGDIKRRNIVVIDVGNQTDGLAAAHLVIIPARTALGYTYPARVGEVFTLEAQIEATTTNSFRTGAIVQLGFPFEGIPATVAALAEGDLDLATIIEELLGDVLPNAPAAARPLTPSPINNSIIVLGDGPPILSGACALMGVETAALLAVLAVATAVPLIRRR